MLAADILLTIALLLLTNAWRQHVQERGTWGSSQKTTFVIVTVFAIISLVLRFLPLFPRLNA